ncbi:SLC13 family permease [Haloplanus aerogenes]|uniref:SLC13/DASS family transporter n=1 Tax=Haloplanus aerogenes TaxID=660522 RepID=A0A3M0CXK7_9EURY|nr:SLC13 family permease [Haloplanus aerogenes]AZH25120.1 SLC13/DASS family transporter [Haloplanus aerogenes]RMB13654.1 sodium-dependent dicarboxylate transporter 2/3/5 [Haloplanus aerogenes]
MTGARGAAVFVLALASALAVGVAAGPVAALSPAAGYALGVTVFAAVLWLTGAIPLSLTALAIPVLLTVFGVVTDFADAVTGFADPVVFLLLAGFVLAEALQSHGVDRRVAYHVLLRLGTSPRRLVLAVMVVTAFLSMVISNTATTAMMVPIAVGLVGEVTDVWAVDDGAGAGERDGDADAAAGVSPHAATLDTDPSNFQLAMLLGVAYAASLGGVGTLVGTPPNAIVVGQLRELLDYHVSFLDWLLVGLPMVVVTLPVAWVLLTFVVYPPQVGDVSDARESARRSLAAAGELDADARRTVLIFAVTAALWLLGGLGFLFEPYLPTAVYTTLFGGAGVSVFGTTGHEGLLYYVVVGLAAVVALVVTDAAAWDDLLDIDWRTLVLLGGGISLANALVATGATEWLASVTLGALGPAPLPVVVLVVVTLVVVVGELASNTAMAAILAPLLVGIGPAYADVLGTSTTTAAAFLALVGAVAASYGFALPVATPPNAIAYGAGYMDKDDMLRAGLPLDAVVILLATGVLTLLLRFVWPVVLA